MAYVFRSAHHFYGVTLVNEYALLVIPQVCTNFFVVVMRLIVVEDRED